MVEYPITHQEGSLRMFNFLKSKAKTEKEQTEEKKSLFSRLRHGLKKTRSKISGGLGSLLLGKKEIDKELLDKIETLLITADVGVSVTSELINSVTDQVSRKKLNNSEELMRSLETQLQNILEPCTAPLAIDETKKPYIILMVGVNGVGKTTTIGKLAKKLQDGGLSVMLAAGDTFRAAAIEQLVIWGERNNVPVVSQKTGSDSASVIFDAIQSAKAKNIDVLIADTAGRLHTQHNLMQELEKIHRVITKMDSSAPHEVMLVLDACTGQNALQQAKMFKDTAKVSGITLTKLDGTAKGGIIFAIAKELQIPIRFIGVGESIEDLQPFDSKAFIDALFNGAEVTEQEVST